MEGELFISLGEGFALGFDLLAGPFLRRAVEGVEFLKDAWAVLLLQVCRLLL
jgi:hypothetical protein